jgi:hypothetical protein
MAGLAATSRTAATVAELVALAMARAEPANNLQLLQMPEQQEPTPSVRCPGQHDKDWTR